MPDLSEIFIASLKKHLEGQPYGIKTRVAKTVGISPSHLGDILAQRTYGTEEKRRAIAAYFGYPDAMYEDFLKIGRQELGLIEEDEISPGLSPAQQRLEAEKWKDKYLAELKSHDETLNALLVARRKIAELEKRGIVERYGGNKGHKILTGDG